jgi:hypothetical protein
MPEIIGVPIPFTPRLAPLEDHVPFTHADQDRGDGGPEEEHDIPPAEPADDEQHRQEGDYFTGHIENGPKDILHAPRRLIADALDALLSC